MNHTAYGLFWISGFASGFAGGMWVLSVRKARSRVSVQALLVAILGCLVGSRWQFRMEYLDVVHAVLIPPREMLSTGGRLPLGLALGGTLGLAYSWLRSGSWRATGDALAVGASLLIAVGRWGCLLNGCCSGTVCAAWAMPFCVRYPPGSETYGLQLSSGAIKYGSVTSLPVHPLPLYFAAAAIVTLTVLVWLLRRGAPAGSLLLAFSILRPISKLSLEHLRATAPGGPNALMFWIPTTTLVIALSVLGATVFWRRIPALR